MFAAFQEIMIGKPVENIVATFQKPLAGIFYLVVRRPMLYIYKYINIYMYLYILSISLYSLSSYGIYIYINLFICFRWHFMEV